MNDRDFQKHIQAYLDGTISADAMEELNRHLDESPEARREFSVWLDLDTVLGENAKAHLALAGAVTPLPVSEIAFASPAKSARGSLRPVILLAAAAVIVGLVSVATLWSGAFPGFNSDPSFARVTKGAGVPELSDGTKLGSERQIISAGSAEMKTAPGAIVVIEAPAEFYFESSDKLHLLSGRLSADVPPAAKGFTVVTRSGEAIDLGTRFGVDVPESGAPEIHVFEGEVIARQNQSDGQPDENHRQSLIGGEALSFQNAGKGTNPDIASETRELRTGAFIHSEEIPSLSAGLIAGQQSRSEAALEKLSRDPALIRLLDFEAIDLPEGTFRIVQGRWPGSRAPEFIYAGDHMKLPAADPLIYPKVTVGAWVRLDRLGAPYQSLLHVDGWNEGDPGKLHWMITRQTTMRLALFGNRLSPESDDPEGFPDSHTPVLPEQGRWVHLAVVYDSVAGTARFFLNGAFDKQSILDVSHPARFGPSRIGNWNRYDRKLSGRIDELLLLGRAMSDREIEALYAAGNPYH